MALDHLTPLPPAHALDFYKVLGTVNGLLLLLGYPDGTALEEATKRLAECEPRTGR